MSEAQEQRIKELNREMDAAKAERDRLNEEASKWAAKRNGFHEEMKKLRAEVKSLREKRDAENDEVRRIKALREETRAKYSEKLERIKQLRAKIPKPGEKEYEVTALNLQKEIESLEWKIQTSSLSLDEERKLVDEVRSLESRLEAQRKTEGIRTEIVKIQGELSRFKDEITANREKIASKASQSQTFHQKMIENLEKIGKVKAEADEMHKKYLENREKAQVFNSRYDELLGQIKSIRQAVRERDEKERSQEAADLRLKLEKEAEEKLKNRRKLTFEEFKILAEEGKI